MTYTSWKRARRGSVARSSKAGATFKPRIVITGDCHTWDIPDVWWMRVAQPAFEEIVGAGARDIGQITLSLLRGETGSCELPPSLDVEIDNPAAENYWDGSEQMLFLAEHVAEAVRDGLTRFEEEPDAGPRLVLPAPPEKPVRPGPPGP